MRTLSIGREHAAATGIQSTTGRATSGTGSTHALHWVEPLALVSKEIWKTKTAEHLAAYAGCGVRTAKRWLSKRGSISVEHFIAILRGEHGDEFLEAYMSDADAKWWRRQKRIQSMVALRRAQAEQQKLLERLETDFSSE